MKEMDGAWSLTKKQASSWARAFSACRAGCLDCANCAYVSVSLVDSECSWFGACDLARLQMRNEARFRTIFVRDVSGTEPLLQGDIFAGPPQITQDCAPAFAPSVIQHVKRFRAKEGPFEPLTLRSVSIQAPLDHGTRWYGDQCRKLIGNHMHELLNAIVLARAFNVTLFRQSATHSYTCDDLLQSRGRFEQLPVHAPHAVLSSWCSVGDLEQSMRIGKFRFEPGMYSMDNCYNHARWQAHAYSQQSCARP